MHTLSCLFRKPHQPRHPGINPRRGGRKNQGQVLVIFAVSLLALLFFVGLAIDAGVAYVSYGQLKRAVDAAAVAAANNFKRGATYDQMVAAVIESLKLQNVNVDASVLQLNVQICDKDQDGFRDDVRLAAEAPAFLALCPVTDPDPLSTAAPPRKLVWVEARQRTPFYFLSLLGFNNITLSTNSTAEAAAIDLVLVIDTSESMAAECLSPEGADLNHCATFKTPGYGPSTWADYNPADCNATDDGDWTNGISHPSECYPLRGAIDAAQALVGTLYDGYDRISLITFDTTAHTQFSLKTLFGGQRQKVLYDIGMMTNLHDDAPYAKMWPRWRANASKVNAANPEDRDGDGSDADPAKQCWVSRVPTQIEKDSRWDDILNVPCDDETKLDAFDWDGDGVYTDNDDAAGRAWLASTGNTTDAIVSTCTGCGMRAASNELKENGRPGAVWVIIFLSDGAANMSDTHISGGTDPNGEPLVPAAYPGGFCTQRFWPDFCFDYAATPRYCLDAKDLTQPSPFKPLTCPPGSTWEVQSPATSHYSVYDYAFDMTDAAALRVVNPPVAGDPDYNPNEPIGNDIAIYSVGLGPAISYGETILRYMAAVGDDGDRVTDQCATTLAKTSCGQYYFAKTGEDLRPIFDNIASRIYTKITR